MKPGDKAQVVGVGRVETPRVRYFPGDVIEAELVKELGCGFWFVAFPGDLEKGQQVLRVRRVI